MTDAAHLDEIFATLEQFAIRGDRCPQNGEQGLLYSSVPDLARAGRVRIEIYAHNFRRVIILKGEHAGKATAKPASDIKPWKIIDAQGTRVRQRPAFDPSLRRTSRRVPSMPKIG